MNVIHISPFSCNLNLVIWFDYSFHKAWSKIMPDWHASVKFSKDIFLWEHNSRVSNIISIQMDTVLTLPICFWFCNSPFACFSNVIFDAWITPCYWTNLDSVTTGVFQRTWNLSRSVSVKAREPNCCPWSFLYLKNSFEFNQHNSCGKLQLSSRWHCQF